jgi:hypothetical protein
VSEQLSQSLANQVLEGALLVCGLEVDETRVSRVGPLVAVLLNDGERITAQVEPETEPFLVARIVEQEPEEEHVNH